VEAVALDRGQKEKVVARFNADRDDAYREFIDKCDDFETEIAGETAAQHFTYNELEENDVELKKLQGWLEKIKDWIFTVVVLPLRPRPGSRSARACSTVMRGGSSTRMTRTAK
jgi:hypothetical protein